MTNRKPKENYLINDNSANVEPLPEIDHPTYQASNKLLDKVAIVTGGDSGIGAAVALLYAREGADVAIVHYESDEDAQYIAERIEAFGRQAMILQGDIGEPQFCQQIVDSVLDTFGHIDILVNNAGEQHMRSRVQDISDDQLERTFATNFFGNVYLTRAAADELRGGATIINTTSVTAFKGNPELMDYSATKGAIVSWTRALAHNEEILKNKVRVNAVAPGPVWTPLIPATFPAERLENWGQTPLGRAGKAYELAPTYVFLASADSSFITGQVIHVNGGTYSG
ncbi:SDR family oxidoreductase [Paucilactobacillus wasatchensis]|uniref:3-oxoacyl-[acyl-carrier protein] reductase n=1 Tax=Paucilactobacillus wasatchensis TaxID=1335616 RepID=A0A0D0Y501_9LACO|nr:SDR family oxidoreductase [Paucilactobacillus wasatchensis]KIS03368.1 3-oxoacyl-[acyl-carrier protein] reductase [Paucilactobacillus wasatchensis]